MQLIYGMVESQNKKKIKKEGLVNKTEFGYFTRKKGALTIDVHQNFPFFYLSFNFQNNHIT